jgi:hypothetical protein
LAVRIFSKPVKLFILVSTTMLSPIKTVKLEVIELALVAAAPKNFYKLMILSMSSLEIF